MFCDSLFPHTWLQVGPIELCWTHHQLRPSIASWSSHSALHCTTCLCVLHQTESFLRETLNMCTCSANPAKGAVWAQHVCMHARTLTLKEKEEPKLVRPEFKSESYIRKTSEVSVSKEVTEAAYLVVLKAMTWGHGRTDALLLRHVRQPTDTGLRTRHLGWLPLTGALLWMSCWTKRLQGTPGRENTCVWTCPPLHLTSSTWQKTLPACLQPHQPSLLSVPVTICNSTLDSLFLPLITPSYHYLNLWIIVLLNEVSGKLLKKKCCGIFINKFHIQYLNSVSFSFNS